MKRVIVLLAIVGMLADVGPAALIGWEAEDGSSFSGTVSARLGADFNPALSDAGALGGAYITSETDGGGGSPGTDARTVSYSIDFAEAGTYDLYARLGSFLRTDLDESGQVEISDLMYLSVAWLINDNAADIAPVLGDQIVDLQDFAALGLQWLKMPQTHYKRSNWILICSGPVPKQIRH
jgi:hypothetical protein